jgi:hypothetical protein
MWVLSLANNIDLEGVMKVARPRRVASLKIAFLRCGMEKETIEQGVFQGSFSCVTHLTVIIRHAHVSHAPPLACLLDCLAFRDFWFLGTISAKSSILYRNHLGRRSNLWIASRNKQFSYCPFFNLSPIYTRYSTPTACGLRVRLRLRTKARRAEARRWWTKWRISAS